mmetsp:Transcript_22081/g.35675  ORF Transcript_22081/g.35675 Transcript_22081/m.35675 type:complete len:83 (+) Transcript_22081:381-629(+)
MFQPNTIGSSEACGDSPFHTCEYPYLYNTTSSTDEAGGTGAAFALPSLAEARAMRRVGHTTHASALACRKAKVALCPKLWAL